VVGSQAWGSLVVQIPLEDGLLVCADRRSISAGTKIRTISTIEKVRQLGSSCGYYITGTPTFGTTTNAKNTIAFDLMAFTKDWFGIRRCSDVTWDEEAFRKSLEDALQKALRSIPAALRPELPARSDEGAILARLSIFYRAAAPSAKLPRTRVTVKEFLLIYPSQTDVSKSQVQIVDRTSFVWLPGGKNLTDALLDENRRDFDRYRAESVMKPGLSVLKTHRGALSLETAKDFAKRFIEIASERKDLQDEPNGVSKESTCIDLDSKGFRILK
jgi:hypothetical protein